MDEQRWYFFRVGLVVLIAVVVLAILTVMFSDILQTQYTVYVELREAPGVTKDTPIRKHGITIGRVKNVEMTPNGVRLSLGIDSDKQLYDDEICQIKTSNFLGDAELAFVTGSMPEQGVRTALEPGDSVVNAAVAPNPMEIINVALDLKENMANTLASVESAGDSIRTASDNVGQITGLVRDVLGENQDGFRQFLENGQAISNKAELALDNFNSIMGGLEDLVGDEDLKTNVADSVAKFPELIQRAEATLGDIRNTIGPYKAVGEKLERNLTNIEDFTKALGEEGPDAVSAIKQSVAKVEDSLGKVETLMANLEEFSVQLKNREGTVGKLFNDPQVYERLNATLGNIERISVQIQPLIADFRVFADSLARDPAQLGVKGAIQRTSGGGSKGGLLGLGAGTRRSSDAYSASPIIDSWIQSDYNVPAEYETYEGGEPMGIPIEQWETPMDSPASGSQEAPRLFPQLQRPVWRPFARD